jgi:hypothetical protein
MAKQSSIIKIRGSIDDLTFLETKDGHQVRKKVKAVSKETIATDSRYARLRENMSEFGRALDGSKLLRFACTKAMLDCSDKRVATRLNKAMMAVLKSDPVSTRGQRNLMKGNISVLKGFLFNNTAELSAILKTELSTSIDRVTGKLVAEIPAFVPDGELLFPTGATHCKFHSAGVEINFETGQYIVKLSESDAIKVSDKVATAAIQLQHDLTANSTNPLLVLVGTRFYQEVNGGLYALKNNSFNALAVADADSV